MALLVTLISRSLMKLYENGISTLPATHTHIFSTPNIYKIDIHSTGVSVTLAGVGTLLLAVAS